MNYLFLSLGHVLGRFVIFSLISKQVLKRYIENIFFTLPFKFMRPVLNLCVHTLQKCGCFCFVFFVYLFLFFLLLRT